MPRGKKELADQITPELREVEVEVGRGKTVPGVLFSATERCTPTRLTPTAEAWSFSAEPHPAESRAYQASARTGRSRTLANNEPNRGGGKPPQIKPQVRRARIWLAVDKAIEFVITWIEIEWLDVMPLSLQPGADALDVLETVDHARAFSECLIVRGKIELSRMNGDPARLQAFHLPFQKPQPQFQRPTMLEGAG
jgi:hypothetical protein